MKLTLAEPKFLKESISIISDIVAEATLKITKESIELVAMDPANVALISFNMKSSSFVTYEIEEDTNLTLNLANFKQVLKRIKANDTLTLELDENKLKVVLQSTTKRTFHLPLIDTEDAEQKIPDLSFEVTVKTQSTVLNDAVDDVGVVGESVTLIASNTLFSVAAKGDLSKATVDIPADENTKIECAKEGSHAKYSIDYLKKMIVGSKLASEVTVKFSTDYPLCVEYVVPEKLKLSFILAPRVDHD